MRKSLLVFFAFLLLAGTYADTTRLHSYVVVDGTSHDARPIPIKFKEGYGYVIGFDWPGEPFQMPDGMSLFILFKGPFEKKAKDLLTFSAKPDLAKLKIKRDFWESGPVDTSAAFPDSVYIELRQPEESLYVVKRGAKGKFIPTEDFFRLKLQALPLSNGSNEKNIDIHLEIPYGLKKWGLVNGK